MRGGCIGFLTNGLLPLYVASLGIPNSQKCTVLFKINIGIQMGRKMAQWSQDHCTHRSAPLPVEQAVSLAPTIPPTQILK